jgi:hypothetical protein
VGLDTGEFRLEGAVMKLTKEQIQAIRQEHEKQQR